MNTKTENLLDCIGQIDESFLAPAGEKSRRAQPKKWLPALAATLALVLGLTAFALRFYDDPAPALATTQGSTPARDNGNHGGGQVENPAEFYSLKGKDFASSAEIPYTQIGDYYGAGAFPGGVNQVFVLGEAFYISAMTRLMGYEETQQTEFYYTLFRYNLEDGSVTAISDELEFVNTEGNRFVYAYSAAPGQKNPDFSNNAQWNDEQPFERAKTECWYIGGEAWIDSEYGSAEIRLTMKDGGKKYTIRPQIPEVLSGTCYPIGVLQKQLFLYGYIKDNASAVFAVNLESGAVTSFALEGVPVSAGVEKTRLGADGFLYTSNGSWLIRVNPADNTAKRLGVAPGHVWEYAVNGEYALCKVAAPTPHEPSKLVAVEMEK